MARLFSKTEGYEGGKYLVLRRDGTVPDWPYLVMGAADPVVPVALRAYAVEAERVGLDPHEARGLGADPGGRAEQAGADETDGEAQQVVVEAWRNHEERHERDDRADQVEHGSKIHAPEVTRRGMIICAGQRRRPRRCPFRAIRDRPANVLPALLIRAALLLDMPLRRSAR
jgi:hypothetical protein